MFVYETLPSQSCQAQNPALGKPSGLVPEGLSTTTCTSVPPPMPKCCTPFSASAAMSCWVADCGAALESSTQLPASTAPPKEGPEPLSSVYCDVTVDQVSE